MKNDGGQAFPRTWEHEKGVTLRDYFAAAALHGIVQYVMSNPDGNFQIIDGEDVRLVPASKGASALAYRYADSMLAERDKP